MKNLKITVNGKTYDVQVEEVGETTSAAAVPASTPAAAPVTAAPAAPAPAAQSDGETVDAPMPGTVLDIKVKAGDSVKKGDCLLVMEAMKMETEIFAPKDCTVTSVLVNKGDAVESGKQLVAVK
ncbi:MAG: biotin/lipoyl-containing protein [Acutalibacteraceae bacterium]